MEDPENRFGISEFGHLVENTTPEQRAQLRKIGQEAIDRILASPLRGQVASAGYTLRHRGLMGEDVYTFMPVEVNAASDNPKIDLSSESIRDAFLWLLTTDTFTDPAGNTYPLDNQDRLEAYGEIYAYAKSQAFPREAVDLIFDHVISLVSVE